MADETVISQLGLNALSVTAFNGLIEASAGSLAGSGLVKLRENLKSYKPDANHEIQEAVLRSYLLATLQSCGIYGETIGIPAHHHMVKSLLPRILAKIEILGHKLNHTEHLLPENVEELLRRQYYELPSWLKAKVESKANKIAGKVFGENPLTLGLNEVPAENDPDEKVWIKKVSEEYNELLIQLSQKKLDFPETFENAAINELLADKGLLMQAKNAKEREYIVRELLLGQVEQEIVGKFGELPKNFRAFFLDNWFNYFCGSFQYQLSHNPALARKFQSKILANIEADTKKIIYSLEKFTGEFGSRLKDIEKNQAWLEVKQEQGFDEIKQILLSAMPLIATINDEGIRINLIKELRPEFQRVIDEISRIVREVGKENENIIVKVGDKVIEANKSEIANLSNQMNENFQILGEKVDSIKEIQVQQQEALQNIKQFRRNILAKKDLTIIERLLGNRRLDRIFGNLTPQEDFFVETKRRYTERYYNKLDGRFEITLTASDDLDSEVKKEYTGTYEGRGQIDEAFEYMRNAFQHANCLIVVGEPGVGKTVLLLKFANDLSDKTVEKLNSQPELRLDDIEDPIPVIFNLASWSEEYEYFKDWLIAMLRTGEGLSELFAGELLSKRKIFLLLDGLDELAKDEPPERAAKIRKKCFDSIAGFLEGGQQAVICCRIKQYWQIRKDIGQENKKQRKKIPEIFVNNLTEDQIKDALKRASETKVDRNSAPDISEILENQKSSVFLDVLSVPFYFTTALEVFDSPILKKRNIPVNEKDLKNYLIEQLLLKKLKTKPPEPKKYKYKESLKWLDWLAKNLNKKDKITFELADLCRLDVPRIWRYYLVFSILFGLAFTLTWVTFLTPSGMPIRFKLLVLLSGPLFAFGFFHLSKQIVTEDIKEFDFSVIFTPAFWVGGLIVFIANFIGFPLIHLSLYLAFGSLNYNLYQTLFIGIIRGVGVGIVLSIWYSFIQINSTKKFANLNSPYQRIYNHFIKLLLTRFFILFGIFGFLILFSSFAIGLTFQLLIGLFLFSLVFVSPLIIAVARHSIFQHFILRLYLTLEGSMPLKYATFLDYAAAAKILEKDGGFWRFRHQELQNYFTLETAKFLSES